MSPAIVNILREFFLSNFFHSIFIHFSIKKRAEIFKALDLNENFSSYEGWVGDFIRYISRYENLKGESESQKKSKTKPNNLFSFLFFFFSIIILILALTLPSFF